MPHLICPQCHHTARITRPALRYVVETVVNGAPAWLLANGLVVRSLADAHAWDTQAEAHAYASAHLDDRSVRFVKGVRR